MGVSPAGRSVEEWASWVGALDPRVRMVRVALDGVGFAEAEPLLAAVAGRGRELELVAHVSESDPAALAVLQRLTSVAGLYVRYSGDDALPAFLRLAAQMAIPTYVLAPLRDDALEDAARVARIAEPGSRKAVFRATCGGLASPHAWAERLAALRAEGLRVAMEGCLPRCEVLGADGRGCPGGVVSAVLDADGTVRPCEAGPAAGQDLSAAWRSEAFQAWRGRGLSCPACGESPAAAVEGWDAISLEARPRLSCRREPHAAAVLLYDARDFRRFAVLPADAADLLDAVEDGQTRGQIEERGGRPLLQRLYVERFLTFR